MKRPWPKLSETLPHLGGREYCQECCRRAEDMIQLYCECDENDQPMPIAISLCKPCADRIIEPHPRLYILIDQHQPFPGAMATCADCKHRSGLKCTNPIAIINGGPGLPVKFPEPTHYHVCARGGRGGMKTLWHGPPTCDAKEAVS